MPIITKEGVLKLRDDAQNGKPLLVTPVGSRASAAPTTGRSGASKQQVRPRATAAAGPPSDRRPSSSFSGHEGSLSASESDNYLASEREHRRRRRLGQRQQPSGTDESESRMTDDDSAEELMQDDGGPLMMALDDRELVADNYAPSETSTSELRDDSERTATVCEPDEGNGGELAGHDDKMREADDEGDEDDEEGGLDRRDAYEEDDLGDQKQRLRQQQQQPMPAQRRGSSSITGTGLGYEQDSFYIGNNDDELMPEDGSDEYYLDQENEQRAMEDGEAPVDEEGEFYSALATVPEEEGKLSDRDTVGELYENDGEIVRYDQQEQNNDPADLLQQQQQFTQGDPTTNQQQLMAGGAKKQLPTIVENGFEAQVLEYLACRKGLRRNQLFSVDEEPSSYQDEAGSQASQGTNCDNVQQLESGAPGDKQGANYAEGPLERLVVMVEKGDEALGERAECGREPRGRIKDYEQMDSLDGQQRLELEAETELEPSPEGEERTLEMSPETANKTSLEQEEYDEQYRDINNLDDLDRRATNHVHAIDGHSKSMLNDIHQQRTIVDYFDENEPADAKRMLPEPMLPGVEFGGQPNTTGLMGLMGLEGGQQQQHGENYLAANEQLQRQIQQAEYLDEEAREFNQQQQRPEPVDEFDEHADGAYGEDDAEVMAMMMMKDEHDDSQAGGLMMGQQQQHEQDGAEMMMMMNELGDEAQVGALGRPRGRADQAGEQEEGARERQELPDALSASGLPRARIRWITAVNKIVNRSSEVSRAQKM